MHMKKYIQYIIGSSALALVPFISFAQVTQTRGSAQAINTLDDLAGQVLVFINGTLVPLVFAIAFLVFIWGLFRYLIAKGADDESRKSGKNLMLWGLIAFFVMVSVWGIVNIAVGTFNLDNSVDGVIPTTPGQR